MTSEDDFRRAMYATGADLEFLRLLFADWLQDRDDPRAAGYRALARLDRRPDFAVGIHCGGRLGNPMGAWEWWEPDRDSGRYDCPERLPRDWFDALESPYPYTLMRGEWRATLSHDYTSRADAEDAAALAWSKLTEEQQKAILAPPKRKRAKNR